MVPREGSSEPSISAEYLEGFLRNNGMRIPAQLIADVRILIMGCEEEIADRLREELKGECVKIESYHGTFSSGWHSADFEPNCIIIDPTYDSHEAQRTIDELATFSGTRDVPVIRIYRGSKKGESGQFAFLTKFWSRFSYKSLADRIFGLIQTKRKVA